MKYIIKANSGSKGYVNGYLDDTEEFQFDVYMAKKFTKAKAEKWIRENENFYMGTDLKIIEVK